ACRTPCCSTAAAGGKAHPWAMSVFSRSAMCCMPAAVASSLQYAQVPDHGTAASLLGWYDLQPSLGEVHRDVPHRRSVFFAAAFGKAFPVNEVRVEFTDVVTQRVMPPTFRYPLVHPTPVLDFCEHLHLLVGQRDTPVGATSGHGAETDQGQFAPDVPGL